jgi:uncharacterized membrane protein (UPF0127 family)
MSSQRRIEHVSSTQILVERARWCDSFASKLRGFTLRRQLDAGEGLVLVEKRESRINSAIHMLFVFCDLGVLWLDAQGRVVDKVVAKPWRLSYTPAAPAQYVVESHPHIVDRAQVGDQLRFIDPAGG